MGFRYRRSYKILPGVRVNVGKKSTSVTFGGKIFRTTVNKTRGTVTRSVSTPIKGLTYTETQRIAKRAPKARRQAAKQPVEYSPTTYRVCAKLMFGIAVVAAILAVSCLAVSLFGYAVGMVAFSALSLFLWKSWRDKADQLSGTKNTGKPEPQNLTDFQKEMQAILRSAQEDVTLLNSTTNPAEFFEGYDRLLEKARVLAQAEGRISFSGKSPRSLLAELSDPEKRAAVTSDFLERCLASGRWNAQSQAMEELRPYWQMISESCREKLCALPELSPEEYQEVNQMASKRSRQSGGNGAGCLKICLYVLFWPITLTYFYAKWCARNNAAYSDRSLTKRPWFWTTVVLVIVLLIASFFPSGTDSPESSSATDPSTSISSSVQSASASETSDSSAAESTESVSSLPKSSSASAAQSDPAPVAPESVPAAVDSVPAESAEPAGEQEPAYSEPQTTPAVVPEPSTPQETMVWIPTHGGERYHSRAGCSNMIDPIQVPLSEAEARGFTPCGRCY